MLRLRPCSPSGSGRAPRGTSSVPTGSVTSWPGVAGMCAIPRRAPSSCVVAELPTIDGEVVYGRRPVAEARQGRRRVRRVWTSEQLPAADLSRLAGSPDHQGVVAEVDPYPYADAGSLLGRPESLVLALDQVQDTRNLGAIARSAEAAAADGLVIPSRRSAAVTAATCKASAGAVEHLSIARVTNLATGSPRPRLKVPGSTAPTPTPIPRTRKPTSPARWCWSWGARAAVCAHVSRACATCWSRYRSVARSHR